ncbi:MAG: SPFH domain-containing protein [Methanoregula sp.]|nr:SPFH domain-containing protein [Methanoregula sp.]
MALDIFGNTKRDFKSGETARNTFYWPDNLKESFILWRLPRNVSWNDNIQVRPDEMAVFLRDGKVLQVFDQPGRYALTTQNVPVLATLGKMVTGVEQIGEVYWLQKREFRSDFNSPDSFTFRDIELDVVRLIASGQFAFKVTDPMLFITQFVGTRGLQSASRESEITSWLKDQIMMVLNTTLGKLKNEKKMAVLDMPAYLPEIEQICLSKLLSETQQYGIQITKFSGLSITLPEEVQKSIDKRSSMAVVGARNFMEFQTAQAVGGIGEGAAKGGGDASSFAGMGAGMGAGYVMGQAMTQSLNSTPSSRITSTGISGSPTKCSKCGYQIHDVSKFCPNCANPMLSSQEGEIACPHCNSRRIHPSEKFCPDCGKQVINSCPNCNSTLKPGAKFCQNCGNQIT